MYTQGYITEDEYNSACAETITLTETSSSTENATRSSQNSYFTDALYYELLNDLQEKLNMTADEAKSMIFNGGSAGLLHRGPRGPDGHRECHVRCRGQHPGAVA